MYNEVQYLSHILLLQGLFLMKGTTLAKESLCLNTIMLHAQEMKLLLHNVPIPPFLDRPVLITLVHTGTAPQIKVQGYHVLVHPQTSPSAPMVMYF